MITVSSTEKVAMTMSATLICSVRLFLAALISDTGEVIASFIPLLRVRNAIFLSSPRHV